MTSLTVQLLTEMIDEPYRPTPVRHLPQKKRAQYQSAAVARTREKVGAALEQGVILPTRQHVRDALTDAALHMIRTDGPGAETIRQVLASVFGAEVEAAVSKIADGKIEPKFFNPS